MGGAGQPTSLVPSGAKFFSDHFQMWQRHFNGLVQERHNSSALAMELCLSCTNPSIFCPKLSEKFDYGGSTSVNM